MVGSSHETLELGGLSINHYDIYWRNAVWRTWHFVDSAPFLLYPSTLSTIFSVEHHPPIPEQQMARYDMYMICRSVMCICPRRVADDHRFRNKNGYTRALCHCQKRCTFVTPWFFASARNVACFKLSFCVHVYFYPHTFMGRHHAKFIFDICLEILDAS